MQYNFDQVVLQFDADQQMGIYIILAFIMFGVALRIRIEDFKTLFLNPKGVWVGLLSQFLLLPLCTFLVVSQLQPSPSLALGMFLVAACPGGNISNFMTTHAKADIPLSVTLTACSSALSVVLTPLNFVAYASLYPPTQELLQSISINGDEVLKLQGLMLVLPLVVGMAFSKYQADFSQRMARVLHPLSLVIFILLVAGAFWNNSALFMNYFQVFFYWVLIHNAMALVSGYGLGKVLGLTPQSCRTIALETGIQNSGLGLVIVFAFFQGLGGMAIITGWWGIWHIISGLSVATYFRLRPIEP